MCTMRISVMIVCASVFSVYTSDLLVQERSNSVRRRSIKRWVKVTVENQNTRKSNRVIVFVDENGGTFGDVATRIKELYGDYDVLLVHGDIRYNHTSAQCLSKYYWGKYNSEESTLKATVFRSLQD